MKMRSLAVLPGKLYMYSVPDEQCRLLLYIGQNNYIDTWAAAGSAFKLEFITMSPASMGAEAFWWTFTVDIR